MNANRAIKLMHKYGKCPKCGNSKIGNGEGTVVIGAGRFERSCKCGWVVKVGV